MTDATYGLPFDSEVDPTFGRPYAVHGDCMPMIKLPAGWWIIPAVFTGTAGWAALFMSVMF